MLFLAHHTFTWKYQWICTTIFWITASHAKMSNPETNTYVYDPLLLKESLATTRRRRLVSNRVVFFLLTPFIPSYLLHLTLSHLSNSTPGCWVPVQSNEIVSRSKRHGEVFLIAEEVLISVRETDTRQSADSFHYTPSLCRCVICVCRCENWQGTAMCLCAHPGRHLQYTYRHSSTTVWACVSSKCVYLPSGRSSLMHNT